MRSLVLRVSPRFDLRHTALLLAGLSRRVHIRLRADPAIASGVVLHCIAADRRIVVDLSDHADQFDEAGLAWCDQYLKRSLTSAREKVVPFGLNFGGRRTWSALTAAYARGDLRSAADLFRRAHERDYALAPDARKEQVVLLQTRLWEADECPGDDTINEQRIELVAHLQQAFGARFKGGLIDTPLARKLAPSLVARNLKQREYVRWQRNAQVAVYTRGLFGSLAFKMAEYLASSKCIVSEPMLTMLPTPLVDGVHLKVFSSIAGCIEACEAMLQAPGHFPENAWNYYQQHVRLAADAVRSILGEDRGDVGKPAEGSC